MREYRELPIALIDESDNIRRSFSEERLQELAASIRQRGVLKPILVRPDGERFRVIDGWRRLSAAKLAECRTIPVRVRDIEENAAEEEMIIANLDHEDVTPLDEATSYQRLLDKGRTVDELAARLRKSNVTSTRRPTLRRGPRPREFSGIWTTRPHPRRCDIMATNFETYSHLRLTSRNADRYARISNATESHNWVRHDGILFSVS